MHYLLFPLFPLFPSISFLLGREDSIHLKRLRLLRCTQCEPFSSPSSFSPSYISLPLLYLHLRSLVHVRHYSEVHRMWMSQFSFFLSCVPFLSSPSSPLSFFVSRFCLLFLLLSFHLSSFLINNESSHGLSGLRTNDLLVHPSALTTTITLLLLFLFLFLPFPAPPSFLPF